MREMRTRVKILSLLLIAVMALGFFPAFAMAAGSAEIDSVRFEDIVTINNTDELVRFLNGDLGANNAYFQLAQGGVFDLTAQGTFQGRGYVYDVPFTGTFDGNGQTITGLNLTPAVGAINDIGLIRSAGPGAVIKNLTLSDARYTDASLTGWGSVSSGIGLLLGGTVSGVESIAISNITITNGSISIGAVAQSNKRVGGLVGGVRTGSTLNITDVNVAADIVITNGTAANFAGGLVGENNGNLNVGVSEPEEGEEGAERGVNLVNVPIRRTGTTAIFVNAGGVLGRSTAGGNIVIEDTRVSSNTVFGGAHVGGIVGHTAVAGSVTIRDSEIAAGVVIQSNAAGDVGGIIGLAANVTVLERVANRGTSVTGATGTVNAGGLIGRSSGVVIINGGRNYALISHTPSAVRRLGGLVGQSTNRIEITNGFNSGNLTGGGGRESANRMGGIIGEANHSATLANQRIVLTNVENRGNVTRAMHTVGGTIGRINGGNNATSVTYILNAVNHGAMMTTQNGGGIVGHIEATQRTLIGGGSLNYGFIDVSLDGQTTSVARRNASIGGIIGNNVAANVRVHQAGNYGRVRGLHRGVGTAVASRGGQGGIVGRQAGAGLLIQEVFNMGHISSQGDSRMTGGIIGHQRAGGTIEDFFMAGTVSSTGGRSRESGIIGNRSSGTMTVRRGYVATRPSASGVMLGKSSSVANPAVAGMSFSQVYVLNTIGPPGRAPGNVAGGTTANSDILQNHRGGIIVGSDMLAMGLLPGISGGVWRTGIYNTEGQSTFPYFAWQTSHTDSGLQEQFFYQITPDTLFAGTAVTGETIASFSGVSSDLAQTRIFNPRVAPPGNAAANVSGRPTLTATAGTAAIPHHNVLGTSEPVATRGRITFGLISPEGVIAFGAAADSDFFVVNAVDIDCPDRSVIDHARFTAIGVGMEVTLNEDGLMLLRKGTIVPGTHSISAAALGYEMAEGQGAITQVDLDVGSIEIEMRRVPINRQINVFIRDGSREMAEGALQPNLLATADGISSAQMGTTEFEHGERVWRGNVSADVEGTNTSANRLFMILPNTVTIGDLMQVSSAGFDREQFNFTIAHLEEITPTGALRMTIYLEDIRLASPVPVRVVHETGIDQDTGDPIFTNIPSAILTAEPAEGRIPPIGELSVMGGNPFSLLNASMYTVLRVDAPGFIAREVLAGDYYEPADADEGIVAGIMIVLEPEITFDVLVVEEVRIDGEIRQRPISGSYLHLHEQALPGSGEADNRGLFESVIAAEGDIIVGSADGFYYYRNTHEVTRENNGRTMDSEEGPIVITLTRETPPRGTIRGFVWNNGSGVDTIPGARVMLLRTVQGQGLVFEDYVYANEFGFFAFNSIDEGTYRIIASAEGFITNTAAVDPIVLSGSQGILTDIYMSPVAVGQPSEPYILMVDVISSLTGLPVAAEDMNVTFNDLGLTHDGETWRITLPEATSGYVTVEASGYQIAAENITADSFGQFQFRSVRIVLMPLMADIRARFHFDGGYEDVVIALGEAIASHMIPVPATRHGVQGSPGQAFLGWFTVEPFPHMHYINNPDRAVAFDLESDIIYEMLDDGVLNLYASWLRYGNVLGRGTNTTMPNMLDHGTLHQRALGAITNYELIMELADVNVDKAVNMTDHGMLHQHLLGQQTILGIPAP